jgi:DNA polymerase-3 subunit delta'
VPFRDVIGHRRIVALLARAVVNQSLPPSLIFAGPDSLNQHRTAIAVAQALNCQRPAAAGAADLDACGACAACTRILRGVHPDVPVLEPGDSGSIKIDQVRDVIDRVQYRPFEGRRRVVIIKDADALVAGAQHALLKTLEEPPPASVFILLTARPDMLLATVRSRCIRLWFPEGATEGAAPGSRDTAQRVLRQAATTADPRRRIESAKDLVAVPGSSAAADRGQLADHLLAIGSLLRDVELLASHADAGRLANPDMRESLDRLTPAYKGDRGLRAFAAVDSALEALNRNAGVKIVADWLVLQL